MVRKLMDAKGLLAVIAISVLLVIAGCSENAPLSPDSEQNLELGKAASAIGLSIADTVGVRANVCQSVNANSGGTIAVNSKAYAHKFVVNPGAVDSNVAISIKYSKEKIDGKNVAIFEFGPSGLVFKNPAILQFEIADLAPTARVGRLYYFDPELEDWVLQESAKIANGKAKFQIHHFSKYAIAD